MITLLSSKSENPPLPPPIPHPGHTDCSIDGEQWYHRVSDEGRERATVAGRQQHRESARERSSRKKTGGFKERDRGRETREQQPASQREGSNMGRGSSMVGQQGNSKI